MFSHLSKHDSCSWDRSSVFFPLRFTSSRVKDNRIYSLHMYRTETTWDHQWISHLVCWLTALSTFWIQLSFKNTNTQTLVPPKDATSIDCSGWLPPPPTNEWLLQSVLHGCPCCFEVTCPWVLLNLILHLIPKSFQCAAFLQVRSAQWQVVSYKRTRVSGSVHLLAFAEMGTKLFFPDQACCIGDNL